MYWIGVGLFALGTVCGMFVRFPFFVLVLLGAIVIAALPVHGMVSILLNALIAVVVLQVGYAAGVILRAALRPSRSATPDAASIARKRAVRLRPGQKHH